MRRITLNHINGVLQSNRVFDTEEFRDPGKCFEKYFETGWGGKRQLMTNLRNFSRRMKEMYRCLKENLNQLSFDDPDIVVPTEEIYRIRKEIESVITNIGRLKALFNLRTYESKETSKEERRFLRTISDTLVEIRSEIEQAYMSSLDYKKTLREIEESQRRHF